jgi:hypothetical protein
VRNQSRVTDERSRRFSAVRRQVLQPGQFLRQGIGFAHIAVALLGELAILAGQLIDSLAGGDQFLCSDRAVRQVSRENPPLGTAGHPDARIAGLTILLQHLHRGAGPDHPHDAEPGALPRPQRDLDFHEPGFGRSRQRDEGGEEDDNERSHGQGDQEEQRHVFYRVGAPNPPPRRGTAPGNSGPR